MHSGFRLAAMLLVVGGVARAQGDPARAFDPATAAQRAAGTKVRVDLIGDSTQTNNAGYGRGFCANLTAEVDCVDMAKGGASTRTFREQGLWDRALETKPDYMVIQFGHNDLVTKDGKGAVDRTHLNEKGKAVFGRIVADNLVRTLVELGPDVVGVPAQ